MLATPRQSRTSREIQLSANRQLTNRVWCDLKARCRYVRYFESVQIDVQDGVATLSGEVESYYIKQILQTYVARTAGIRRVLNHVVVSEPF